MKTRYYWVKLFFYFGYIFLYTPIFLIIAYSLNASQTIVWQGISWKWYQSLLQNELLLDGTITSFKIALISASLAVVLGTVCAHLWTSPPHKKKGLGFLATTPLVIPELVSGLSLLSFFVWMETHLGWPQRGMLTIIVAHTTLGAAYVTAIVRARLSFIDPSLSEAALDLGASPYKVFFLIKLPLVFPSLIASWLIAFIISFDDVVLASFTSGPGTTTLPLVIFSSIKVGYTPQINALATCITVMVSLFIMAAGYIFYRKDSS
jgi:putrescine transport system permease protein